MWFERSVRKKIFLYCFKMIRLKWKQGRKREKVYFLSIFLIFPAFPPLSFRAFVIFFIVCRKTDFTYFILLFILPLSLSFCVHSFFESQTRSNLNKKSCNKKANSRSVKIATQQQIGIHHLSLPLPPSLPISLTFSLNTFCQKLWWKLPVIFCTFPYEKHGNRKRNKKKRKKEKK